MKLHNLFIMLLAAVLFACGGASTENTNEGEGEANGETSDVAMASLTDGQYSLVDGSQLMWEGTAVGKSHDGTLGITSGSFSVSGGALAAGEFTIDMNSIANNDLGDEESKMKLVGHLKSDDFFGVEANPTATFTLKNAQPTTEEGATHEITGDLTLKGKTNEITFPATLSQEGDNISIAASFNIDRTRWEVKFRSPQFPEFADIAADKIISDEMKVEFNLTASAASAQ